MSACIKSSIKLTIGMLVSNHISYIRKAMEALKPLLQAVPSELVVIDTKGTETDGSIAVVREYTDKIYPFTWCDDFAAARNECIKHARGEWFLYVDDDEWFDDVTEFIEFFKSGECEKYNSGFYQTRDYDNEGGYSMGIAGRMIRRRENTCFVGRVHEGFNEVYPPYKQFQCFTHHMGYAFVDEEAEKKHQERNVSILKKELADRGYTPRLCAQMLQELLHRKETAKAGYEFAVKCIPALEKQGVLLDSCSQWVLVGTVRYFAQQKDYEGMKKQAVQIQERYPLSNIATLVLSAVVVRMAGEQGDLKTLLDYVPLYLEQYDWQQEHEEEALVQTQLDFPQYFTEAYYENVVRAGIIAANHLGKYTTANEYWKRVPWDREGFDSSGYMEELQITRRGLQELQKKLMEQQKRKKREDELGSMLAMLKETGNYLRQQALQGSLAELPEFLTGMQQVAISLGNGMEELYGEAPEAIALLEEYCELVWQCSQTINTGEVLSYLKMMDTLLDKVYGSFTA